MELNVVNTESTKLSASLMRGLLQVNVDPSSILPESLFGFAERRNPKRAFLFVSRVLGKHIPVTPSVMQASYESLASKIPADLPGPVLVVGMAETAVGLGAGVHRAYSATRHDSMYIVSTRHPVATEMFARFEEEHSHASAHLVHAPADPDIREMMLNARSLVLVDDEASTGKTFINLHRALIDAGLNKVERVVTCVLTDWSDGAVSDDDQLHFLTGIAQRISRQEDVMAQVNSQPADQVMHGLFPKRVEDIVLDAMTDHEKLSLEVLDNVTKSRAFALVIYKMLKAMNSVDEQAMRGL